jgi:hypothetical protein
MPWWSDFPGKQLLERVADGRRGVLVGQRAEQRDAHGARVEAVRVRSAHSAAVDMLHRRTRGLISVRERAGRAVHRVVGHPEDLTSVTAAAAAVVAERTGSSGY